jgi:hypothetical protein
MQTEFAFRLPRGYLDASGELHNHGRMRLATALDEIQALQSPLVQANEAYLPVVLLSRVITQLGRLEEINMHLVESLFAADIAYLEDLYLRLNSPQAVTLGAVCPHCHRQFHLQVAPLESSGG